MSRQGFAVVGQRLWMVAACIVTSLITSPAAACTSAVILGSATTDGRPLLWKNRDTDHLRNEIVYFAPREIRGRTSQAFVAVTNANCTMPWAGLNESGFAIINTLVLDMCVDGCLYWGDSHAEIMREALRWCRSVEDFEAMLIRTDGKRVCASTFAVIDAHGRGVTFETGPRYHVMFDAADPRVAAASCTPGVVVRSNFTFTANHFAIGTRPTDEQIEDDSYHRFDRAEELLTAGDAGRKFDLAYLLNTVARDHDRPLASQPPLIDTRQTISRLRGASTIVIQGVKPGEDPRTATMWVILGQPSLSVAVPTWVAMRETSEIVDGPETSPLSDAAEQLRDEVHTGTDDDLRLIAARLPGIQEDTLLAEQANLEQTTAALKRWRQQGVNIAEMRQIHESACKRAVDTLKGELGTK